METKRKVLIVDDNENIVRSLMDFLEEDYYCHGVFNADEAINILQKDDFDIIISDIRMPGKTGFELLSWLQANKPGIKVIMMTAYGSTSVKQAVRQKGAVYYLEKPIDYNKIPELIERSFSPKGFIADIQDLDLIDILQVLSFSGKNCTLLITNRFGEEGKIHIKNGIILNAETEYSEKVEAFYDIIKWEGGTFKTTELSPKAKDEMNASIEFLLLEASRIKDEGEKVYKEVENSVLSGDKEDYIVKLKDELENCVTLSGIDAKSDRVLFNKDTGNTEHLVELDREIVINLGDKGGKTVKELVISTDKMSHIISLIGSTGIWLVAIFKKPANMGFNHLLINRHQKSLEELVKKI